MNRIWEKIKNRIDKVFNSDEEKDYLTKLTENLKEVQRNHQSIPFRIKSAKRTGFIAKTGGMYAYVSFHHMPWEYKSLEHWRAVSKHLIDKSFFCKIYRISETETPISILLNAENHRFPNKKLIELEEYKGVVIQKSKYGLFVDIGYHYDWEFGSFVGLIHKSTYRNDDSLLDAELGDVVRTNFHGTTKDGEIILGNRKLQKEWQTGELENLIGTVQTAMLMEDESGRRQFFIDGKFKTTIHLNKDIYPSKTSVKKELKSLKKFSTVECKILRISKGNNFVSELLKIEN